MYSHIFTDPDPIDKISRNRKYITGGGAAIALPVLSGPATPSAINMLSNLDIIMIILIIKFTVSPSI